MSLSKPASSPGSSRKSERSDKQNSDNKKGALLIALPSFWYFVTPQRPRAVVVGIGTLDLFHALC